MDAATRASAGASRGGRKHVVAEMGGKNAILVFADADAEDAAAGILISAFGHAGRKCSAAARVVVQRPLFDRLVSLLVDGAQSLPVGPAHDSGTAINPVIDADARQRIRRWAAIAREEGTVVLDRLESADATEGAGADRPEASEPSPPDGYSLGLSIVTHPPAAAGRAHTAQEEIYDPAFDRRWPGAG